MLSGLDMQKLKEAALQAERRVAERRQRQHQLEMEALRQQLRSHASGGGHAARVVEEESDRQEATHSLRHSSRSQLQQQQQQQQQKQGQSQPQSGDIWGELPGSRVGMSMPVPGRQGREQVAAVVELEEYETEEEDVELPAVTQFVDSSHPNPLGVPVVGGASGADRHGGSAGGEWTSPLRGEGGVQSAWPPASRRMAWIEDQHPQKGMMEPEGVGDGEVDDDDDEYEEVVPMVVFASPRHYEVGTPLWARSVLTHHVRGWKQRLRYHSVKSETLRSSCVSSLLPPPITSPPSPLPCCVWFHLWCGVRCM